MLTADFGEIVSDKQNMVASVHMVRQYGRMQRESVGMVDDLRIMVTAVSVVHFISSSVRLFSLLVFIP